MTVADAHLRPAVAGDAATIARLYMEAADEAVDREPTHFHPPNMEAIQRQYAGKAPSDDEFLVVAEKDEEVVGFVQARLVRPREQETMIRPRTGAFVEELAVASDHRKCGIGRMLVAAVEEWIRERSGELVMLDTGTKNEGARRFYERIGYREIGVVLIKESDPPR